MNHVYRLVWNAQSRSLVPAPETAKGRGKAGRANNGIIRSRRPATLILAGILGLPGLALAQLAPDALPTGGQVIAGQAGISQQAARMDIHQQSSKAIIDWQSFDIGSQAGVSFQQPDASAVALNRVIAGDASQIYGSLSANGQVWLINPNGVVFGNGAQVDVGGLVASTMDITDQDFLDGKAVFSRNGATGSIVNKGTITAKDGGLVAFLAPTVQNEGIVSAQLGNVVLAGGDRVTLEAGANGHLQVAVDPATVNTLIENRQLIVADGGQVIMTAKAADALQSSIVANTGTVQARTLQEKDGRILLLADMGHGETLAAGELNAKFVETSAAQVTLDKDLVVNTQGGTWLIDPTDITIDSAKASAIQTGLSSGDVTVTTTDGGTDAGNIHVDAGIDWSANTLTLRADNDIHINATLNSSGTTGNDGLVLQYAQTTGSGNYYVHAPVNLAAGSLFQTQKGSDSAVTYTVITSLGAAGSTTSTDLQGINGNRNGNFVLGSDIDASATATWNDNGSGGYYGFAPIGNFYTKFTGIFDGLGHSISGLTISRSATDYISLFGYTDGATIRNVGLVGGSVTGHSYVGGLVGYNDSGSTISNSYASASVTSSYYNAGGLVGYNGDGSTISNSYATGNVTGGENEYYAGGLVGYNSYSAISNSYATGSVGGGNRVGGLVGYNYYSTVSNSYATGSVKGDNAEVGGLVGYNQSSPVSDSYATGSVKGGKYVGGLVGYNYDSSPVSNSYATGSVESVNPYVVGGLMGYNYYSTVSNSYYAITNTNGDTINNSGSTDGTWSGNSNGTAKTWIELTDANTFNGWDTGIWVLAGGGDQARGYGISGLPWLIGVTPAADRQITTLFDGGMGVDGDAYGISSWQQLANVGYNSAVLGGGYHFALKQNLGSGSSGYTELASATANGGSGWNPIGNSSNKFTGTFDGQDNKISDLVIDRPSEDYVGMFGYTDGATISNVGLVGGSVKGQSQVGGLAGHIENTSVNNSYTASDVTGGGVEVGGLGGVAIDSSITNSYASGNVVSGGNYVGGLVGDSFNLTIENSYATGNVLGTNHVGGLVGYFDGTITHSYASGSVIGNSEVGGLTGTGSTGITASYYVTTDANGHAINIGSNSNGSSKTWVELTNASVFSGWDTNVWTLGGDGGGDTVAGYGVGSLPWLTGVTREQDKQVTTLFDGGMGVDGNAYGISSWQQLANIGYNSAVLGGDYHFELTQNLDESSTGYDSLASTTANGNLGWKPIGDNSTNDADSRFSGVFDGLGHTISDLTMDRSGQDTLGLFGYIDTASVLRNIGIKDADIKGQTGIGILAGINHGTISNGWSTGVINATTSGIGGLVGLNKGDIKTSWSNANITVSGTGEVSGHGGLAGYNYKFIEDSYALGSVNGNIAVGGLVGGNVVSGGNNGIIRNSFAMGQVSGRESSTTGGLVGNDWSAPGNIQNSYWVKQTTGQSATGGLNGSGIAINTLADLQAALPAGFDTSVWANADNQSTPYLKSTSHSLAYVATDPGTTNLYDIIQNATQLQGINGDLTGYYALGNDIDASVTSGWNDGAGFAPIGDDSSKFAGVFDGLGYAISDLVIDRPSEDYVGLFGYTDGATIRNVGIADAHIKGKHSSGILVGALDGIVISSWTSGFINGGAGVGGLIGGYGYGSGTILNSHSSATVSGSGNDIGGLMGHLSAGGVIRQSYATGNVSGVGGIAGLVGSIRGTIYDSYATGTANGSWYVGGLVGLNWENGKIYNSYSSTTVTGSGGGLVGYALSGSLTADSFWNTQTSGKSSSSGGIGKTTAQMQDPFTFIDAGWDFGSVWAKSSANEHGGYMMLKEMQAGTYYDGYLRLDTLSRTYGDANPDLSAAATSVGVSVAWGSAITGTTGAGVYYWTDADVLSLTGGSNLYTQYGDGLTITPKVLNTGLTANNKVYDGDTNAAIDGTLLLSGVINGDDVTLDGAVTTAAFEDANAGNSKTVIVNGLSLSGSGSGNYTLGLPDALTLSADITARPIDITADADQSKVYGEANPTLTYTPEANGSGRGLVGSDTFSGALGRTSGENVGSYAINQGTLANANYAINFIGSNFSITPASLTIAAKSDLGKIYGDTYVFSASDLDVTGLKNAETIGNVDFSSIGAAATAGVNGGAPYTVTVSNATGSSFDAGNYSITYTNGSLTITPAALSVTAKSDLSKTYGDAYSFSASDIEITGLKNSDAIDSVALASAGAAATAAVNGGAPYTVTVGNATGGSFDAGNYNITYNDGALTIAPRPINISANTGQSKVYGEADPALTYSLEANGSGRGLVGSDTFSGALGRTSGENVGSYAIDQGTLANSNYNINFIGSNFGIMPRPIDITADAGQGKVYGEADPTLAYAAETQSSGRGLVSGDSFTGTLERAAGNDVGDYAITQGTLANANYAINFIGDDFSIIARLLTVTANDDSRTYDGSVYSGGNGVAYSGFASGEDESVLGGALAYGGSSQGAVNAGTYVITPSGLSSGNYDIRFEDGTLTIDPATLTAIVASLQGTVHKTYDGTTNATLAPENFSLTGWVGSDGASVTQTSGTYDSAAAGTGKTVTVALSSSDYSATGTTDLNNYSLPTSVSGNVGQIDKAPLTVTANDDSRTAGGAPYSGGNGVVYSGFVSGENADVLVGTLVYGGSSQGENSAGSYSISPSGLTGGNYHIDFVDGTLTILPAPVPDGGGDVGRQPIAGDVARLSGLAATASPGAPGNDSAESADDTTAAAAAPRFGSARQGANAGIPHLALMSDYIRLPQGDHGDGERGRRDRRH